jgi:hypothetical protein
VVHRAMVPGGLFLSMYFYVPEKNHFSGLRR